MRLRIAVPLRASDGAVLSPRDVDHAKTPPIELVSVNLEESALRPMTGFVLSFERPVTAADVVAQGALTAGGNVLEIVASEIGHKLVVRAAHGFPPGIDARFAWKEGPIALTSIGRVKLDPIVRPVKRGLFVRVGEPGEHCTASVHPHHSCAPGRVHLVFSAPIPDDALALHVHPPLARATTGDLRGHRFEVDVPKKKKLTIVLDGELFDTFGQTLGGKKTTLEIEPSN